MWLALDIGYGVYLLLAIPAAGFLVRLFMIQHDCGHGAFFRHRLANDWVGRVIGVLTLTPYDFWKRTHAIHHATSGNLERRGMGDIDTLTVDEYLALSRWGRLRYRFYRHPAVMFGIGPAYLFVIQHRLPVGMMRTSWQPWASTMATNAGIALAAAIMIWLIGIGPIRRGIAARAGMSTRRRCAAAPTTIFRLSCTGSPPTSGFIMCITCAAVFRSTGCRRPCGRIPGSRTWAG
jgi:omega-6 fatty acid desaturase (delta-12 desaturase)